MDVGSSVINDLHRKSEYVQIRLREVVITIAALRNTQFNLTYCEFDLDKFTHDIASDVLSTLTLVGEFPQASELLPENQSKSHMHVVEEAIKLNFIENIPMHSQRQLEGFECIIIQDLSLTQLQNDLEANPLKMFHVPDDFIA
jgi:hypothetical protein